MPRYFLEVAYKGTNYSGSQIQKNANTVQAEIEKALYVVCRVSVSLTGSSRTDAGVHALQNYFHFDFDTTLPSTLVYKLNAVLPPDIALINLLLVSNDAHARFHALSREYEYHIYRKKNPFIRETAFYFPYSLNLEILKDTSAIIKEQTNFSAFCKTNTQSTNSVCVVQASNWRIENGVLIYRVKANRFLRGMVRALTATQLQVARGAISIEGFTELFDEPGRKCTFSTPPTGLTLVTVCYPQSCFPS